MDEHSFVGIQFDEWKSWYSITENIPEDDDTYFMFDKSTPYNVIENVIVSILPTDSPLLVDHILHTNETSLKLVSTRYQLHDQQGEYIEYNDVNHAMTYCKGKNYVLGILNYGNRVILHWTLSLSESDTSDIWWATLDDFEIDKKGF